MALLLEDEMHILEKLPIIYSPRKGMNNDKLRFIESSPVSCLDNVNFSDPGACWKALWSFSDPSDNKSLLKSCYDIGITIDSLADETVVLNFEQVARIFGFVATFKHQLKNNRAWLQKSKNFLCNSVYISEFVCGQDFSGRKESSYIGKRARTNRKQELIKSYWI